MKKTTGSAGTASTGAAAKPQFKPPFWLGPPNGDIVTQSEIAALRDASLLAARLGENAARRIELGATIERGALTINDIDNPLHGRKPGQRVPVGDFAGYAGWPAAGRVYWSTLAEATMGFFRETKRLPPPPSCCEEPLAPWEPREEPVATNLSAAKKTRPKLKSSLAGNA